MSKSNIERKVKDIEARLGYTRRPKLRPPSIFPEVNELRMQHIKSGFEAYADSDFELVALPLSVAYIKFKAMGNSEDQEELTRLRALALAVGSREFGSLQEAEKRLHEWTEQLDEYIPIIMKEAQRREARAEAEDLTL